MQSLLFHWRVKDLNLQNTNFEDLRKTVLLVVYPQGIHTIFLLNQKALQHDLKLNITYQDWSNKVLT